MTIGKDLIQAAQEAALWTRATKGGTELPSEADRGFLSLLDLKQPYFVLGQHPLGTFSRCERLGWASIRSGGAWLLTDAGRAVLNTRVHQLPAVAADEGEGS